MPRIITRAIAVKMDKSALVGDGTGNAPTGIASVSCIGYDDPLNHRGGFDLIAQGMGGIIHLTVEPDGSPTIVGLPISDICTGMFSAHGVLAALWQREKTGEGCLLETSLLETSIGLSSWTSAGWLAQESPLEPTRQGSRNR
jgi:crotonobetainyl-CoA:carnitine CoA-transferase CaiB-like acyl-CoA transferase